jgi:hypothetical protein
MAQLTGNKIKDTYLGLLKTNGSGILTSGFQRITDGSGLGSQLYLSLTQIKFHDAYIFPNADGSADQVLSTDGSGALSWKDDANSGTVTSVALSVPTGLTVTNSPITTSGTIAIANTSGYSIPTDAKQTQWDTAYTNRITTATSPLSITTNTISLNTVPVSNGGTGATTLTGILLGDGTNTITAITDGSADTFLKTDGSGGYSFSDVGGGDVLKTGTIAQNKIAIWNDNDSTLRSDPTLTIDADHKITLFQPDPSGSDISNYNIGGGNQGIATGANNIGFGINNLNSLTTGYSNIAIGYGLQGTTTGYENICLGSNSLFYNDIGSRNICIGISSLFNNRSGTYNISIGYQSLVTTQTGINNIGIGKYSLQYSTGSGNIAIGSNSGSALATGSNNVIIGTATGSTINGLSNCIIISDGGGNIRQTFDASGDATFIGNIGVGGGTPSFFTPYSVASFGSLSTTSNGITIASTTAGNGLIEFADGSGGGADAYSGYIQYAHTADSLTFGTAGSDRVRITSGGNVGIGTNSPGFYGLSFNNIVTISSADASTDYAIIELAGGSAVGGGIQFGNQTVRQAGIFSLNGSDLGFFTNSTNSGSSLTQGMRITSGGNVGIGTTPNSWTSAWTVLQLTTGSLFTTDTTVGTPSGQIGIANNYYYNGTNNVRTYSGFASDYLQFNGNHLFRVAGSDASGTNPSFINALQISSGGVVSIPNGVVFNNNSVAGNKTNVTLNAYEEGTWTPIINQGGANVTLTHSYGTYTRVGNLLHISFYLYSNTPNSLSGSWVVKGLPYSLKFLNQGAYQNIQFGYNSINGADYSFTESGRGQVNTTSALDVYSSWYNTSFTTVSLEVSGSGTLLIA